MRQIFTDRSNTILQNTPAGRSGGTAVFDERDGDKCVIVVKVTGIDSLSVWFEMDGWMKSEIEDHASGLVGVKME